MNTSKQKYYIVWRGHNPGIYETWNDCQRQIKKYPQPRYKKYTGITKVEAQTLLEDGAEKALVEPTVPHSLIIRYADTKADIVSNGIAVDASCLGNPGKMEYRGIYLNTLTPAFSSTVYALGTVNMGEFLAIVHAMAQMKKTGNITPIYSDSITAISWVKNKKCNSKLEVNEQTKPLWNVIDRAEAWLQSQDLSKYIIYKWNTHQLGEIPADYNRK